MREAIGIHDLPLPSLKEEELALKLFYANLAFQDERYCICWPWKSFPPKLRNNCTLALGRLCTLHSKLSVSQFQEYDGIIKQQLAAGFIEAVPQQQRMMDEAYYLLHRAILQPDKTTKTRIVYNGSPRPSKRENSLNDVIYKGVNMLADLTAVLLRFRFMPVVLFSDIEKAFLQLLIADNDRNYVHFLWFSEYDPVFGSSHVIMYRFTHVAFGIVASLFLMNVVIRFHIDNDQNEFSNQLR